MSPRNVYQLFHRALLRITFSSWSGGTLTVMNLKPDNVRLASNVIANPKF